jgi:Short C-terminal domain
MRRGATGVAVVVLIVSIFGFVGSLLLHALSGDYDKFGSVAVPGTGKVALPKGEVDLFFVAYTPTSGNGQVTIPDLKFSLDVPDGFTEPTVRQDNGGATSVNTKEHARVWKVQIKTAGTYTVTTDGDVDAFIDPRLSFGTGSPWPGWLPFAFGSLFVVAICGLAVASKLGDGDHVGGDIGVGRGPAFGGWPAPPVTTGAPTYQGPEPSMARLQQLGQLQELHASGALSDSEYDAARQRLGG